MTFDHTYASAIVGAQKNHKRKEADFYPTPPDVTEALMRFLNLPRNSVVWEPACGDGAMSRILERHVSDVVSSDLRDEPDIYGRPAIDFLSWPEEADDAFRPDWIITNPPFNVAEAFIKHALSITPNVAMLLKSQYWHAARRSKLFEQHPPAWILPLTWRPAFLEAERGRSPLMDVIWCVWTAEDVWETRFRPLERPKMSIFGAKEQSDAHEYLAMLGFKF